MRLLVFCEEQLLCCVVEKPSPALAMEAIAFGSDETCYGHVYVFCAAFAVINWVISDMMVKNVVFTRCTILFHPQFWSRLYDDEILCRSSLQ